jgi:hypothetical protein
MLAFAIMFSIVFIIPSVSAGGITSTPGGTKIAVTPDQEFLLRHEFFFDQSAGGYFAMAIYWDAPSSDENFTPENAPSVYWISGPESGSPVENVQWDNNNIYTAAPGQWQVSTFIDSGDKNYVDGHFNVDIWLRAASGDGTPHKENVKQQISYGFGIAVTEQTLRVVQIENVTIDVKGVLPPPEHAKFPWLPVAIVAVIIAIAIIATLMAWMRRRPREQKRSI